MAVRSSASVYRSKTDENAAKKFNAMVRGSGRERFSPRILSILERSSRYHEKQTYKVQKNIWNAALSTWRNSKIQTPIQICMDLITIETQCTTEPYSKDYVFNIPGNVLIDIELLPMSKNRSLEYVTWLPGPHPTKRIH